MELIYGAEKSVNPEKNLAVIEVFFLRVWKFRIMVLTLPFISVKFVQSWQNKERLSAYMMPC